jgi:long-chain fatty acid transport protein
MRTLIIASLLLVPATARAGGYVIPNENARDLALSESAVAAQSGAEAIFINSAALAGQEGLNISGALELLVNRTDWSDPDLGDASLNQQMNTPPTAAISYGRRIDRDKAWGVGAGFGVPGGGSLVWPEGWAGREAIQSVKQQVFAVGAGAAIQPLPYIKIGASYLRYQVVEELHQSVNYLDHFGDAGLAMSGGANAFGVAIEARAPQVPLTLAVTYKHSADLRLEGDAHFTAVPPGLQAMLHDQGVTEDLTIPNEWFFGAAYEVMPRLRVMAAVNLEGWHVYKEDRFIGADGFTVAVPRNYEDAYVIRLGGEWEKPAFAPALTLRAGFLRSMSPQPTDTVSPSLTDGDSTAFSIGAGLAVMANLRVDIGWQHAIFDDVKATGPDAFPGTYQTNVDLVSLGFNWRSDLGAK